MTRAPRGAALWALCVGAACLVAAAGCAPAAPSFAGGSTTPLDRHDLAVGAAYRIPLGELAPGGRRGAIPDAEPGGAAPVASWRWGLSRHYDFGVMVWGTNAQVEVRREVVLEEATTRPVLLFSLGGFGGVVDGAEEGRGAREGGQGAALFAVEAGGLYDLWAGLRLSAEHEGGNLAMLDGSSFASTDLLGLSAGAVLGLAAGFRRLHALIELSAAWEHWSGTQGGTSVTLSGPVLTPAFALRLRL